jgi:hypothetical protein
MNAINPLQPIIDLLDDAQARLKASNDQAQAEADKRDWQELKRMLEKHGICNVFGVASDLIGDIACEFPEGSNEERDYLFAQEVAHLASQATDLPYGCMYQPLGNNRQKRIDELREGARRLRV